MRGCSLALGNGYNVTGLGQSANKQHTTHVGIGCVSIVNVVRASTITYNFIHRILANRHFSQFQRSARVEGKDMGVHAAGIRLLGQRTAAIGDPVRFTADAGHDLHIEALVGICGSPVLVVHEDSLINLQFPGFTGVGHRHSLSGSGRIDYSSLAFVYSLHAFHGFFFHIVGHANRQAFDGFVLTGLDIHGSVAVSKLNFAIFPVDIRIQMDMEGVLTLPILIHGAFHNLFQDQLAGIAGISEYGFKSLAEVFNLYSAADSTATGVCRKAFRRSFLLTNRIDSAHGQSGQLNSIRAVQGDRALAILVESIAAKGSGQRNIIHRQFHVEQERISMVSGIVADHVLPDLKISCLPRVFICHGGCSAGVDGSFARVAFKGLHAAHTAGIHRSHRAANGHVIIIGFNDGVLGAVRQISRVDGVAVAQIKRSNSLTIHNTELHCAKLFGIAGGNAQFNLIRIGDGNSIMELLGIGMIRRHRAVHSLAHDQAAHLLGVGEGSTGGVSADSAFTAGGCGHEAALIGPFFGDGVVDTGRQAGNHCSLVVLQLDAFDD